MSDFNPIESGIQQLYQEIKESLELILHQEVAKGDVRNAILISLDDAISNNWDELVMSFWKGVKDAVHQDLEIWEQL